MSETQRKYLANLRKNKILVRFTQVFIAIIFIGLWELFTKLGYINDFIFSSPSAIFNTIINLGKEGNLWGHIFTTVGETLIAFILGIVLGLIIAIILYQFKFIAKVCDPFLTLLNSLPKIALGPVIIIWMGANIKSIIFMALLINLIVNIVTIYNGFSSTDKNKLKLMDTFNASKFQTLIKLVIPASYPTIISSLKLNISMSLIGVIMGEFLVSKRGLGYLIIYGKQVFDLTLVMSAITLLLIISFILYKFIIYIEKKLLNEV